MELNTFGFGSGGSGGGADAITGSGTTNKIAKFTDANIIGNSLITDDGSTVYIGSSATSAKAAFEINSTTQGVLLPRLTTTQINAIAIGAATNSLLVYSTTANRFRYYNHASADVNKWETLATLNDIPASPTTLYSGDGSLSSSRTVTMGVNSLLFAGNITTFRGIGTTSGTSSLLVQDSGSNDLFRVRNDGAVISANGYWQGTVKILYINPNSTTGNLFVGENSGNATMTGAGNVGIGKNSMLSNTTGAENIVIGINALQNNTTGDSNDVFGAYALLTNTTGVQNTAFGNYALNLYIGNSSTAFGYSALKNTTVQGTAFGTSALQNNTTGNYNTAIGLLAMGSNTTGSFNTAIGLNALQSNVVGNNNVAIGVQTLLYSTSSNNTGVGDGALFNQTTGSVNTAIGTSALYLNTEGARNVALGYRAGYYAVTDNDSLYIHNGLGVVNLATGKSNSLIYGIFAAAVADQRLNLNASISIGGGVANATSVLNIANLPISPDGLQPGDVWDNGGVLTIV